ncbi:MAG: tetratricopeptide repeat protein [Nitrospirota bacterium]|jgi:tetratricopeptide (TPR) repeat protein
MKGSFFLYWAWGGALAIVLLVITVVVYQALTIPPNFSHAIARAESNSAGSLAQSEGPFPLRTPDGWRVVERPDATGTAGGDAEAFSPPDRGHRYLTLLVDALEADRERDPDRVRAVLEELRRLDAPEPRIYRWLGSLYHQEGDYLAAAAAFERAVELSPGHAPDLFNLATIYLLEERYPRAIHTFNRIIPLQPPFLDDVYAYLGYCLHAMGEEVAARQAWQVSMQLDPDNAVAHRYLKSEVASVEPQGNGGVTGHRPALAPPAATGSARPE